MSSAINTSKLKKRVVEIYEDYVATGKTDYHAEDLSLKTTIRRSIAESVFDVVGNYLQGIEKTLFDRGINPTYDEQYEVLYKKHFLYCGDFRYNGVLNACGL